MTKKSRKARTPPFAAYPAWSDAKFWSFIRSGLRSKWSRWPPKYEVLAAAKRKSKSENKRLKYEYQCAACRGWFPNSAVSVDHINPVGTLRDYDDLPSFVRRLFVGVEQLQVLCSACHSIKTREDNERSKANRMSS